MIAAGDPGLEDSANDEPAARTARHVPLSRRVLRVTLLIAVSFAVTLIVLVLLFRDRTPRLTFERLQQAQQIWDEQGLDDYRLTLRKLGNRTDDISIEVRDGKPVAFSLNGATPDQQRVWEYWTVPSMFETLGQELRSADSPERGFGASTGAVPTLRVQFDQRFGYPQYYLRSVDGDPLTVGWQVGTFAPLDDSVPSTE